MGICICILFITLYNHGGCHNGGFQYIIKYIIISILMLLSVFYEDTRT